MLDEPGKNARACWSTCTGPAAPLWLLDEPTLGLDDLAVERLGSLLIRHREGGGMIVAATHVSLPLQGAGTLRLSAITEASNDEGGQDIIR